MKHWILIGLVLLLGTACNKVELGTDVKETFFVRTEGADMPVYVRGNTAAGKYILVIHGGPGGESYSYSLSRAMRMLGDDYGMLFWDQRGQGASQGYYNASEVTIERMRLDLKAVVHAIRERYGDDSGLYLMGHSWGGLLGTAFVQSPDQVLVDGWIEVAGAHDLPLLYQSVYTMLDTFADREIAAEREVAFWQRVDSTLETLPANSPTTDDFLTINQLGGQAEDRIEDVVGDSLNTISLSQAITRSPIDQLALLFSSAETGNLLIDEVVQTNLTPTMSEIQVPTLLLWGNYDFIVPPALASSAILVIGTNDKEVHYFELSGHSPFSNEPDEFHDVVKDWVDCH